MVGLEPTLTTIFILWSKARPVNRGSGTGSGEVGLRVRPVTREIPFGALRLLRAGSSLRLKNGSVQDDAFYRFYRKSQIPYASAASFFFTLTTVILAKPSSKAGGFSFEAMRRITSSGTTRSRR